MSNRKCIHVHLYKLCLSTHTKISLNTPSYAEIENSEWKGKPAFEWRDLNLLFTAFLFFCHLILTVNIYWLEIIEAFRQNNYIKTQHFEMVVAENGKKEAKKEKKMTINEQIF